MRERGERQKEIEKGKSFRADRVKEGGKREEGEGASIVGDARAKRVEGVARALRGRCARGGGGTTGGGGGRGRGDSGDGTSRT